MRYWYVPLAVLGVGGVGVLLVSRKARQAAGQLLHIAQSAPETVLQLNAAWNEAAQQELERLQAALNRLAESLAPEAHSPQP